MSEFHVQIGRNDRKAGRHSLPPGLSGQALQDWKNGHGEGWILPESRPAQSSTMTAPPRRPVEQTAYTPFSTAKTKRRANLQRGDAPSARSGLPNRSIDRETLAKTRSKSSRSHSIQTTKKPEMGLFGIIELETTSTKTRPPTPIPDVDRDAELLALQHIGIGLSAAVDLIAANWTIDQLKCRWQLNDWSDHPKFVQDVQAIVTAHCEQSWPTQKIKNKEVSHVGTVAQEVSGTSDRRIHHDQSA